MKFLKYSSLVALLIGSSSVFALADLDDIDISDEIDIRAFEIGDDGDVGNLFYVVDRTTSNCFVLARDKRPGGMAIVNCESLKAVPRIKSFLEDGNLGSSDQ